MKRSDEHLGMLLSHTSILYYRLCLMHTLDITTDRQTGHVSSVRTKNCPSTMDKLASASDVLPCCNASRVAFILFFISFICSGAIVTSPTSSTSVVAVKLVAF